MSDAVEVVKALLIAINPPITSRTNLFEGIALLLGICGIFLVYYGIRHAEYRRENLKRSGQNGILKLIADENVRVEKERRVKIVLIIVAAAAAASVPSSNSGTAWVGSLISIAFMALIFYIVKGAWNAFEYRRRMDAKLSEMDKEAYLEQIFAGRRKEDTNDDAQVGLPGP